MATQEEIGGYLCLTPRQIRNLQDDGILHKSQGRNGMDLKRAVNEYITHLKSKKAAKQADTDPADGESEEYLDIERKKLDNALKSEKLKQVRRENAPVWLLRIAISRLAEAVAGRLDSVPMKMKLAEPALSARAIDACKTVIVECKNDCERIEIDLSEFEPEEEDQELTQE